MGKTKLAVIFMSAVIVAYGLVGGFLERVSARDDPYSQLSIFTDVLRKVQADYVEKPEMTEAINGALQGMMESLDPYSSFVDAAAYKKLQAQSEMSASPGLVLSKRYGYAYVVAVTPGSAAEAEGLRTGDLIEAIEGRVTTRMSLWEAEASLKGAAGSSVAVRVVRARRSEPTEITLRRSETSIPAAAAKIEDGAVGRLTISDFGPETVTSVTSRLKMLIASNVKGLLIDVRGAALGTLDEGVRTADLFLAKGKKIVTVKDRAGNAVEHVALTPPVFANQPVVVLVDGGTSGAAEVFAAALQDNGVATIVGEKTNGYGSEQERFKLGDGSSLFLSTKLYYRPKGDPVQAASLRDSGLKPDVRSPSQEFVTNYYFENTSEDLDDSLVDEFYRELDSAIEKEQLNRGLQVIHEKMAAEKAA